MYLLTAKSAVNSSSWLGFVVPVLVALVTGVFGLLTLWVKFYFDQRKATQDKAAQDRDKKEKDGKLMSTYIQKYSEINQQINEALQILGAQQILVLRVENGGGRPQPGARIYSSVIWEAFDPPATSAHNLWQRQLLEGGYLDVLSDMIMHGSNRVIVGVTDVGIMAQDYYDACGVKAAQMYFLHGSENRIIYMAVSYMNDDTDLDNPARQVKSRALASSLTKILEEMERIEQESR